MAGQTLPTEATKDALKTAIDAASLGATVYKKRVPQGSAMPYIALDMASDLPENNKTTFGTVSTYRIHCWSAERIDDQINALTSGVLEAITDGLLTITGFNTVLNDLENMNTYHDGEEEAWHGIVDIKIVTTGVNQ